MAPGSDDDREFDLDAEGPLGQGIRVPSRPRAALALSVALGLGTGCIGVPSPLAPSQGGSLGLPHDGWITDAVELPSAGTGYQVICHDGLQYGNRRLVGAIQRAAATVHRLRPNGTPLPVCDLSAREGGAVARHRSHRTGRDADLLFYALRTDGQPLMVQFTRFGPDGLARLGPGDYVRLDVEREWLLVRALLTDPEANVQWLYVSRPIEALLIEYARARGDDPRVIWRAESVMMQPWDSKPHDDHLHLRIACTPDEAVRGCAGGGPHWSWLPPLPQLAPMEDRELVLAIVGDLLPSPPRAAAADTTGRDAMGGDP